MKKAEVTTYNNGFGQVYGQTNFGNDVNVNQQK